MTPITIGKWNIYIDQDFQRLLSVPMSLFYSCIVDGPITSEQCGMPFFWNTIPFQSDEKTWDLIYNSTNTSISIRVYKHKDGVSMIRFSEAMAFRHEFLISPDYNNLWASYEENSDGVISDLFFRNLGLMFAYSIISRSGLVLHAVVMEWRGKAILISAASGTGKSTHAHLWQETEQVEIINGDRALCGVEDGIWTAYGQPWCGSSGECLNTSAPIGAVVLLERGEVNSVERLKPFDAVLGLLPRTFAPPWDAELMDAVLGHLDSLAASVPVFRLRCRPDAEAVETLKAALEPLFTQSGGQG